ncbi:condensation domain-containing protein, partial [Sinorhizobium sp. CB9]|uniref:condensation domain-containing protein n=1 Tax=Sinorhizobium sp. CB9 TaxID=3056948 RepID=UPI00352681A0
RSAAAAVVARHESLRTRFAETDGVACQVVGEMADFGWTTSDLAGLEEKDRQEALQRMLATGTGTPFDLVNGPLLRLGLIRLADEEHVLQVAMHHIVSDAWSMPILMKEFAAFYNGARRGEAVELPALAIQYGDYALWQRAWLDEEVVAGQVAYWRGRLGAEHPVLQLPVDRPRTGGRDTAGGLVELAVPADLSKKLGHLSQAHGATLFMTLLSAFQLLLYRYSGQSQIRVGVPVAGRNRLETQDLIGFFVNTLVLRGDLAGSMTVAELIEQARIRTLEAQVHQDLPFARLVEELQPVRDLSSSPLFQVMFNMEQAGMGATAVDLDGLAVLPQAGAVGAAQYDLVLNAGETADGLTLGFAYARD